MYCFSIVVLYRLVYFDGIVSTEFIFLMISFETMFLSIVALPIGLILSYSIVEYYSVVGIDLSIVEAGLENFGVGTRLYFKVPNQEYFIVAIMVFVISIIFCIDFKL